MAGNGSTAEVERLIEVGLAAYGAGQLDTALEAWQQALTLSPDDARVRSYVEYLCTHYQLLDENAEIQVEGNPDDSPLGSDVDGSYLTYDVDMVALNAATAVARDTTVHRDIDEGWNIEEPTSDGSEPYDNRAAAQEHRAHTVSYADAENDNPDDDDEPEISVANDDHEFGSGADEVTLGRRGSLGFVRPNQHVLPRDTLKTPPMAARSQSEVRRTTTLDDIADGDQAEFDHDSRRTRQMSAVDSFELDLEAAAVLGDSSGRGEEPDDDEPEMTIAPIEAPTTQFAVPRNSVNQFADLDLAPVEEPTTQFRVPGISFDELLELGPALGEAIPNSDLSTAAVTIHDPLGLQLDPTDEESDWSQVGSGEQSRATQDLGLLRNEALALAGDLELDLATPVPAVQPALGPPGDFDRARLALLHDVDAGAPYGESPSEMQKRRIQALLTRGVEADVAGDLPTAALATILALSEAPESAAAQKLAYRSSDSIQRILQRYLGDLSASPRLAISLNQLSQESIDSRAAFLVSRVDGILTWDEILDVSGMARLEAFRHLAGLALRGVLVVD